MNEPPLFRRLIWLTVAAGALLRVVRFAVRSSLWGDEASLALSIVQRSLGGLLQPLEYEQSAPLGFLFLEKAATLAFGNGEFALRLVPLAAGIASLAVFPLVARRVLGDRAAFLATLMFALSDPQVFYSVQVKQYSLEVLIGLLFTLTALDIERNGTSSARTAALGLTGAAGVLFSSSLIFLLAAAGVTLLLAGLLRRDRGLALAAAIGIIPGVLSFAGIYAALLRTARGSDWMIASWRIHFMPVPPRTLADLGWPLRKALDFCNDPLGLPWPPLAAAVTIFGTAAIVRRRQGFPAALAVTTLAVILAASAAQLYPFASQGRYTLFDQIYPYAGRVLLFATPLVFCLTAQGLDTLLALRLPRLPHPLTASLAGGLAGLALLGPMAWKAGRNAWSAPVIHELRPIMEKMAPLRQPGDVYYTQYNTRTVFDFYNRILGWNVPLTPVEMRDPRDLPPMLHLLQQLKPGDRFWFVAVDHPFWHVADDNRVLVWTMRKYAEELATFSDRSAEAHLFRMGSR